MHKNILDPISVKSNGKAGSFRRAILSVSSVLQSVPMKGCEFWERLLLCLLR